MDFFVDSTMRSIGVLYWMKFTVVVIKKNVGELYSISNGASNMMH